MRKNFFWLILDWVIYVACSSKIRLINTRTYNLTLAILISASSFLNLQLLAGVILLLVFTLIMINDLMYSGEISTYPCSFNIVLFQLTVLIDE